MPKSNGSSSARLFIEIVGAIAIALGVFIGTPYIRGVISYEICVSKEEYDSMKNKLFITKEHQALLEREVEALQKQLFAATRQQAEEIKKKRNSIAYKNNSADQHTKQMAREELYASAMEALQQNDLEQARKLLNQLLLETDDEQQREQAIEGLLSVFDKIIDNLSGVPGETNIKLWMLFEMHKLSPSDAIKHDIVNLSQQAYEDAQQFLNENNVLASADLYASLMHLSKMMDYEVTTATGTKMQSEDFAGELKKIQKNPDYLPLLEARAENKLYNGTDIEKVFVFWDYANLATLNGSESLQNGEFREEFIQASLLHLNHLKEMNQPGDIKSRMDYIRWAFPAVMTDERISSFY
jgi:hypothetical protein